MKLSKFQSNFPKGSEVPSLLVDLLDFQNQSRAWYSGHFQLDSSKYGDASEFDGDKEIALQFASFGRESDGSVYALWLRREEK